MSCSLCENVSDIANESFEAIYNETFGCKMPPGMRFCYICKALIGKFYKFKKKCLRAQSCLHASKENPVHKISQSKTINTDITYDCNVYMDDLQNDNNYISPVDEEGLEDIANASSDVDDHIMTKFDNNDLTSFVDSPEPMENAEDRLDDMSDGGLLLDTDTANEPQRFVKIMLTLEEQRKELERKRRDGRYLRAEFKCYSCGVGYHYEEMYLVHMVRHEESNGRFLCELCRLRFASSHAKSKHIAKHTTRYKCLSCGAVLIPTARAAHLCDSTAEFIECCHCGIHLKNKDSLRQHMARKHRKNSEVFSCHICNKQFTYLHNLRIHTLTHTRIFKCSMCPFECAKPHSLTKHVKKHYEKKESGSQPYCVQCDKVFANEKNYKTHMKLAAGHRDFSKSKMCTTCGMDFATNRDLKRHYLHKHSLMANSFLTRATAKRSRPKNQYICDVCGKFYLTKTVLSRHIKIHDKS